MTGFLRRLLRRLVLTSLAGLGLAGGSVLAQADYAHTRYPIVLVHGLFGFDSALGIDYFHGVADALRQGGAQVYVAQVSAAHGTELRGEQLLAQVQVIRALTGLPKVHLIGHSHGGLTARYVAGVAPELVASVTAVGAPNKGSRLADMLRQAAPPGSVPEAVASTAATALVALIGLFSNAPALAQLPAAALDALTTAGVNDFNRRFPHAVPSDCGNGAELVHGVRYYSWTGTRQLTHLLDPSDAPLALMGLAFDEPNDGMVTACSARLGTHLGDYAHNHLDEINQLLGLRSWFAPDPVGLYRQHAHRLQRLGL